MKKKLIKKTIGDNDYSPGNLLDYASYKKHWKLIATDLSKETKLKDPLQISFIGKLWRNTVFYHRKIRKDYF